MPVVVVPKIFWFSIFVIMALLAVGQILSAIMFAIGWLLGAIYVLSVPREIIDATLKRADEKYKNV